MCPMSRHAIAAPRTKRAQHEGLHTPGTGTRQSRPYPKKTVDGGKGKHSQAIAPENVTSGVMGTSAFFLSCAGTTS